MFDLIVPPKVWKLFEHLKPFFSCMMHSLAESFWPMIALQATMQLTQAEYQPIILKRRPLLNVQLGFYMIILRARVFPCIHKHSHFFSVYIPSRPF